jgi:hypothetical protein
MSIQLSLPATEIEIKPHSAAHLALQMFEHFAQEHYDLEKRQASKDAVGMLTRDLLKIIVSHLIVGFEASSHCRFEVNTAVKNSERPWRVTEIVIIMPSVQNVPDMKLRIGPYDFGSLKTTLAPEELRRGFDVLIKREDGSFFHPIPDSEKGPTLAEAAEVYIEHCKGWSQYGAAMVFLRSPTVLLEEFDTAQQPIFTDQAAWRLRELVKKMPNGSWRWPLDNSTKL